ncbi:MAG: cytochrome c, partial [Gammaproteobacteria bacterium]
MSFRVALCLGLCFCAAVAKAAESPDHPGAAVYGRYCASCHDQGDVTRAPPLSALQQLNAESLLFALSEGVMQEQATGMSRRELAVLIDYLAL